MKLLCAISAVVAALCISADATPTGGEDRHDYYVRPLGAVSPGDIRRPGTVEGNEVSGFYTLVTPKEKWPGGVVAWEYDAANNFTDAEKATIKEAMDIITQTTCITFAEKTSETAYLSIKNAEDGCWAELGYRGKKQEMNMGPNCFEDTTTAIHEIMHAMGFEHEQTRYDRDLYVEVQWSNIAKGEEHNFEKLPRTYAFPQLEFDFLSLMMYTLDAFGRDGRPSMIVNKNPDKVDENDIGRAKNMTDTDIYRIFSAYRCEGTDQEQRSFFSKLPLEGHLQSNFF